MGLQMSVSVRAAERANLVANHTVFKGTVGSPKHEKYIFLRLHLRPFMNKELPSFGDIGRRDFCLLSNIMGLNSAHSPNKIQ